MSTETQAPAAPKRSRWRSFFVGSALVLSGVILGIGGNALSQDYGSRRGWTDDGPGRQERFDRGLDDRDRDGPRGWMGRRFGGDDDGPRGWMGRRFGGDDDGPRGWMGRRFGGDGDGPRGWMGRRFGGDGDGWHGRHFGGGFGGMGLTPGRIERMVNRLGWAVDASSEQKQKLRDVVQRAADDLRPLHEKIRDGRRQAREVLTAPTIDRGKLESLRTDQMKLADQASQRVTAALAEAADVLTPEQRATLGGRLERFGGRRG